MNRRPARALKSFLDFEDDGASFRVRQERQSVRREGWFRRTPLPRLLFWFCAAPVVGFAGLVIGAIVVTALIG